MAMVRCPIETTHAKRARGRAGLRDKKSVKRRSALHLGMQGKNRATRAMGIGTNQHPHPPVFEPEIRMARALCSGKKKERRHEGDAEASRHKQAGKPVRNT